MKNRTEVLVLDDEAIVCERLKEHLESKGFQVETFTESQQAIDRLMKKTFDVVVTDLKMEGPSGLDVLRLVRDQGHGTQVIMITGYASAEAARAADYTGVYEFILKPFQLEEMAKLVKKAAKKAMKRKGGTGE
jgi:DNA-binding NtrC family response regulator